MKFGELNMARPDTKVGLITAANERFDKLIKLIEAVPIQKQNIEFNFNDLSGKTEAHWKRDKNLRDVFAHLYEWHQLLLNWVESNTNGKPAPFLPAPYNWKTYGDINVEFFNKHQATPYAAAKEMLIKSHKMVVETIERFSDAELFTKKHFNWTGSSSLGSYCVSATSSHYDWAIKKITANNK